MFRSTHPVAALRGVAVGTVCFAASLAAHTVAMSGAPWAPSGSAAPHEMSHEMAGHAMGGHSMPGHDMAGMASPGSATPSIPITAVLLLAAACALVGALASRPHGTGRGGLVALLLLGQGTGHLALGATMGHLTMSPGMAVAHLVGAVAAGVVIAGAEHALRSALRALRLLRGIRWRPARTVDLPVWTFRPHPLPALTRHGALRAPPA